VYLRVAASAARWPATMRSACVAEVSTIWCSVRWLPGPAGLGVHVPGAGGSGPAAPGVDSSTAH